MTAPRRHWYDIAPKDAVDIELPRDDIEGPLVDDGSGEVCPWPWEPQQRKGIGLGQYHCTYCGSMVLAGWPHPDYRDDGAESRAEGSRRADQP